MIESFRDLEVWQRSVSLVEVIYRVTGGFPTEERFGLCAQLRRAAVSIPSCIAEGNVRRTTKDYLRFISMAAGSAAEVETQLIIAERLGMLGLEHAADLRERIDHVSRMLNRLRQSLEAKLPRP